MSRPGLPERNEPKGVVALLVEHAVGKCQQCGATLCLDPLPHRCDPWLSIRARNYMEKAELS